MSDVYPDHDGIDLNAALKRLGGRNAMLHKLLNSFLDKYLQAHVHMRELIDQESFEEAQSLAHQIKGAGANLGADAVSTYAAELEASLKEHKGTIEQAPLQKLGKALEALSQYKNKHCQDA